MARVSGGLRPRLVHFFAEGHARWHSVELADAESGGHWLTALSRHELLEEDAAAVVRADEIVVGDGRVAVALETPQ